MKNILLLLALLFGTSLMAQIPTSGLIAWYPFNGNANDASGNGLNGTVYGATLTTDRFGNPNMAYYFNDSSNIIVNDSPLLHIENWSISAWYKTTGSPTGTGRITTKAPSTGTNYLSAIMSSDTMNGSAWNGSEQIYTHDTNNTADNVWHHIVYTRDTAKGEYKLYIDNVLKSTVPDTFKTLVNTANLFIGSSMINSQYWYGSIDDIRIYNRAVDSAEVSALYHEVNPTLGIAGIKAESSFIIYPNPTDGKFTIQSNAASGSSFIEIYNMLGGKVYSASINNGQPLRINLDAPNGIYFLQVRTENGTITKKLVIDK